MNSTTTQNLINTESCTDKQENIFFGFYFANVLFLCCSVFFNGAFFLLNRYKKFHLKLSKGIDIIKSFLAGLIISLFFKDQKSKSIRLESFSSFEMLILNNLPFFSIASVYILVSLGVLIYRVKLYKTNQNNYLSNVYENILPNMGIYNKNTYPLNYTYNDMKKFFLGVAEEFNVYFYPLIYPSVIFFHSFFSGFGFGGHKYVKLSGIIILVHKLYESCRIQESFTNLNFNGTKSLYLMFFLNFLTPIGISIRGYLILNNVLIDTNVLNQLCHKLFVQSFILMTIIEVLIPMPKTWLDVSLNFPITFFSYMYFNQYFKNNDPAF